ncbi:SDR family oxidoreductase [Flavobacteriales bacterium]|jgi:3-oxoacyl-[acyl-carrier protein] reductase|nr:SDR family oxidoreductase [Flavobacteriales bacterium]
MRTVAIIGDSKGIGLALREQLLSEGVRVIGVSRTGAQAAGDYTGLVFDAVAHPCDLTSFTDRLDGLVYCPGTIALKPVRGVKPEQVLEDFKVNALGFLQTVQANLKLLKAAAASPDGGVPSVVGFSTVAVQTGMGFHASIAAAKGAVEGLVRTMAAEFAPDIRVNAIAPSLTDTPLAATLLSTDAKREASAERHPLKRIASAQDVAAAAAFLLSPASAAMTGQVMQVDNGMSTVR